MTTATRCPVCRTQYAGWAQRCSECGVALVLDQEPLDVLALPEESQVVYELEGWSLEQRSELGAVMAEEQIAHAWDGTDLIVSEDDEARLDELCELIEQGLDLDAITAAEPVAEPGAGGDGELDDLDEPITDVDHDGVVDPPGSQVLYELDEWEPDQREALSSALTEAGLPYGWEGTTLVVRASDDAAVEALLDDVEFPDALAVDGGDALAMEGGTGRPPASVDTMSELFIAADRLQHDVGDAGGIAIVAKLVEGLGDYDPPYGIDRPVWNRIVTLADSIADRLAAEDGGDEGDDAIVAEAQELRTILRPYV